MTPQQELDAFWRAYRLEHGEDAEPYDLDHPPGLLGQLVDDLEARSPRLTRAPALAGAIAGFAAATANRFVVKVGRTNFMPLNMFTGIVGVTGGGKDTALRGAGMIAAAAGISGSAFASAEALHTALTTELPDGGDPRNQLSLVDEWGRLMQSLGTDRSSHQRGVMTKLMEIRGMAFGGTMSAKHYSNQGAKKPKLLPAVKSPFVNALFATTQRTLHDALTSADILDGSLNRIVIFYIEGDPDKRPLDEIRTGPLDVRLAGLIQRLKMPKIEPLPASTSGVAYINPVRVADFIGDLVSEGPDETDQSWLVIDCEPAARALLNALYLDEPRRQKADGKYGSLWTRAFENAVKLAGICAVCEALGTDPRADPGPLIVRARTARWAIGVVERAILATIGDLSANISDYPLDRLHQRIRAAAKRLDEQARADPDPKGDNRAPPLIDVEIKALQRMGWFSARALDQRVKGQGVSTKQIREEIGALIALGDLLEREFEWNVVAGGQTTKVQRLLLAVPEQPDEDG